METKFKVGDEVTIIRLVYDTPDDYDQELEYLNDFIGCSFKIKAIREGETNPYVIEILRADTYFGDRELVLTKDFKKENFEILFKASRSSDSTTEQKTE